MAEQCFITKGNAFEITISDDGELYSIKSASPESDSNNLEIMLKRVARSDFEVFLEVFKSLRMDGYGYRWSKRILKEKKQKLETQIKQIEKLL